MRDECKMIEPVIFRFTWFGHRIETSDGTISLRDENNYISSSS
jgi:hypothetical protein